MNSLRIQHDGQIFTTIAAKFAVKRMFAHKAVTLSLRVNSKLNRETRAAPSFHAPTEDGAAAFCCFGLLGLPKV